MDIKKYLEEFVEIFMPENFVWRKGQKEAIISIIEAYKNETKVVILDAPVGSGKSIIGMAVAYILNKHGKDGYILASDISLQEQYEKDFKRFNIKWGSVKGIDNYMCIDNMEKNSLGTCRIRNRKPKGMHCYSQCPYFNARDMAAESPTALLNYAYWLIMQNYVNQHMDEGQQLFPSRDFTICDEGHKILDIVQNHYSPRFDPKTLEKLEKLTDFFKTYKINDHEKDFQSLKDNQILIFDSLIKTYSKELITKAYGNVYNSLEKRLSSEDVKEALRLQNDKTIKLSDAQREAYTHVSKGVKINNETNQIHIFGLVVKKTIVKSIEYKPTNSRELTIVQNKIKKLCEFRQDKYRNFIFEKSDVKLQGITV